MSLPIYPNRVDTGDNLIGSVPAHWTRSALKRLATYQNGFAFKPEDWAAEGQPIIRIAQLTSDAEPNYFAGELDGRLRVSTGDLLFSWSATIDSFIWRAGDAWLNQHIFKVSPTEEATKSYLFYLIKFLAPKLADLDAHGSTMRHIKKESLGQLVYVPTLDEQVAIATFLDRETAKIDTLIAEQENLIALLAEKRQATISHAVTKGLNPNVPMTDSGVAWLGDVPAHWKLCSLRRVISAIEQGWSPECHAREAEEGEWGVLKAGCLNGGIFRPTENKALPPELSPDPSYEIHAGDLLMSRASGSPELVGSTALVMIARPRLLLSDKIFRLRLNSFMVPAYFAAALRSRALRIQIENSLSGGNGMANNLPQSSLLSFLILVPPREEQQAIAEYIDDAVNKMDRLQAESERAMNLLKERRSALIAAAVTGQIDVRDVVTQEIPAKEALFA
ncbi:restriction endonuclease subunit S [Azohydromonas caseinilytica]|uniref:Restriction endonuclease subunit S n=1 Tax=Azohydromonas caseinilytica TaxID=2728836 RepID=A0A848F712_9BURK|nr:restriction endonuclease subunit S [Azohydromonas caseinilytica]NML13861.1 restriction endonuclease subunit S [Azohydromonas caseinilytica]